MNKRVFHTEWAYVCGLLLVALGVALTEKADFGVSMVVAPAYLVYLKLSPTHAFVTFGMAEYALQAVLMIVLAIVLKRFRLSYLFSFVTAVLYGFALDGCMALMRLVPYASIGWRLGYYILGLIVCALGVAFFFHTYVAPEVYELFVKEVAEARGWRMENVKTVYDCCSCLIAIGMSFAFFGWGRFEGVKLGTVVCALINGRIIGLWGRRMEKRFTFADALPLRRYFG